MLNCEKNYKDILLKYKYINVVQDLGNLEFKHFHYDLL